MNNRNWVVSLYETFMLRDLIGYAGPGSILIVGLLSEMGEKDLLKDIFSSWLGMLGLIVVSYITAVGLRLVGPIFAL